MEFKEVAHSLRSQLKCAEQECQTLKEATHFFANLKRELIGRTIYKTCSQARQAIFNYIEMFYNLKRQHTQNGRIAPNEYEARYFRNLKSV